MKKYYPVDFDEKGNAVLGNAKSNPTSNGIIPTAWAPGGSDEGKQGLKSISISPAITTTPALDSLFPIYWEDLTDEQKQQGVNITVDLDPQTEPADYTFTLTPTNDMYAGINGVGTGGWVIGENKGESVSDTVTGLPIVNSSTFIAASALDGDDPPEKMVMVTLTINRG